MFALLPLITAATVAASPSTFHFMKIKEVYPGHDTSGDAQYVVLQMYAAGQTQVAGTQIRVFNRRGAAAGTHTFAANVPNGADQSAILTATGQVGPIFNVPVDLIVPFVSLDRLGGKACFHDPQFLGDIDCVAWGGYTGPATGVGTPFNVPVGLKRGQAMRRRTDICGLPTVLDECDDTDDSANDFVPAVPAPRNNAGVTGTPPPSICGNNLLQGLEQCDDGNVANGDGCSAQCVREPSAFTPAAAVIVDGAPNNNNVVLEPGEVVELRPSWRNAATVILPMEANLVSLTGPPGAIYQLGDDYSDYGNVPPGAIVRCVDCYSGSIAVSNPTPRPVTHWDVTAAEVTTYYGSKSWSLHVGRSFTDVPSTSGFYRFIETLLHRGITGGCTATAYCPASPTTRDSMAVFVLVAKEGPSFAPPPCVAPNTFADVPETSPFCRWIEELERRGVVGGCGGGNYCPQSAVTRDQMAIFVLRTLDPSLDPPACTTPMFNDVPASSLFCRWIEELARRQVVTGCGGGNYCPSSPVTREQMGVFLVATFGLTLYGL